jgi:IS5 family transposase
VEGLITQAKKYKQEYGRYPERICADRIYINIKNRSFCSTNKNRLSGKRLGGPPKDPEIRASHNRQLSAVQHKQTEVEGCLGSGKRKYSLDLVMPRFPKRAESSISMTFVVMCAGKIRRLINLFFDIIFSWLCAWEWPRSLCMVRSNTWQLEMAISLVAV